MKHENLASLAITIDVTKWTQQQRESLFRAVEEIESAPQGVEEADARDDNDDVETTGWTLDAYVEAVTQLLRRHGVQARVINDAIKNGDGYLDRDAVYVLGNYSADRSLKGFTRPVNRIVQGLVDQGTLPEDAADLLMPVYDPKVTGYQRALGFQVPLEIVRLMQDQDVRDGGDNRAI